MATVKDLSKFATTAEMGTQVGQSQAQRRRVCGGQPSPDRFAHALRSSPLDGLDPAASPAEYHDCDGCGDYADAPAPAVPYFNSAGHGAASVPCFDTQLAAALEVLVAQADSPRDADDEAALGGALQPIGDFTDGASPHDPVSPHHGRVIASVENLYETLSLLDDVTLCEPYIN